MTRVLLLDDNLFLLRSLKRLLEVIGYEVSEFLSCGQAMENQEHFDVAVLDIDLRDGSGVEVGRALLQTGRVRSVVFFTGNADADVGQLGPLVAKPNVSALIAALAGTSSTLVAPPRREPRRGGGRARRFGQREARASEEDKLDDGRRLPS